MVLSFRGNIFCARLWVCTPTSNDAPPGWGVGLIVRGRRDKPRWRADKGQEPSSRNLPRRAAPTKKTMHTTAGRTLAK
jgi:hypothetical protein